MRKNKRPFSFYIIFVLIAVIIWLAILLYFNMTSSSGEDAVISSSSSEVLETSETSETSESLETSELSETEETSETSETSESLETSESSEEDEEAFELIDYADIGNYGRKGIRYTQMDYTNAFKWGDDGSNYVSVEIVNESDLEAYVDTVYNTVRNYINELANDMAMDSPTTATLIGVVTGTDGAKHLFMQYGDGTLAVVLVYRASGSTAAYYDIIPLSNSYDEVISFSAVAFDEEEGGLVFS